MPDPATQTSEPKTGDTLIRALWIVTGEDTPPLHNHSLLISEGKITGIFPTSDEAVSDVREVLDLDSHIVMPGLVNAHGHTPMTLFRGYADDLPLQPWLEQKIWPAESRWVSEEFVRDGARLAIAEMLLGGITCFSDMYFFPEQVAAEAESAHIRAQMACPILDFPTAWAQNADEYIRKTTALNDEWRNSELVNCAFGPHAPYTVSDRPLQKIGMLAAELEIPVHIHAHENSLEINESMEQHGKRPLQRLADLGLMSPSLQTVHMTQLLPEEIELLAEHGVHVVHCPASNMKLSSGSCPVTQLIEAGINVCYGTDGAASNNTLDLFSEMRLASLLAKHHSGEAGSLDAATTVRMATLNGARCLGLDGITGSLLPGKAADITAVDLAHASSLPCYSPESALAYSVNSSQVSDVWVAGRRVVKSGELTTLNLETLLDKARFWATRISGS